ncbi:unnamed protein product [Symbiodinium microadriaticum]|nr:unnamed protein product [Symbiodinium microadriaticum]
MPRSGRRSWLRCSSKLSIRSWSSPAPSAKTRSGAALPFLLRNHHRMRPERFWPTSTSRRRASPRVEFESDVLRRGRT